MDPPAERAASSSRPSRADVHCGEPMGNLWWKCLSQLYQVRKRVFCAILYSSLSLPRQARDKHRENSKRDALSYMALQQHNHYSQHSSNSSVVLHRAQHRTVSVEASLDRTVPRRQRQRIVRRPDPNVPNAFARCLQLHPALPQRGRGRERGWLWVCDAGELPDKTINSVSR